MHHIQVITWSCVQNKMEKKVSAHVCVRGRSGLVTCICLERWVYVGSGWEGFFSPPHHYHASLIAAIFCVCLIISPALGAQPTERTPWVTASAGGNYTRVWVLREKRERDVTERQALCCFLPLTPLAWSLRVVFPPNAVSETQWCCQE